MSREMKDSGVEWIGEIPEDWDALPIKRNYSIVAGATPKSDKPENWDGEIPWITPSDYKTEDKYILSGKKSITEKGYNSCSTTMVPANSIIFSKRAPVGTVAISANELCTNQGCLSCVPLNKSNSVFGYYSMIAGKNAFEMAALGTTFMEISADAFANMKLPYCDTTEQQQIVHFLDHKCTAIDTAIEKTKKSIEKLEEYKKAVITKAVTKGIDPNAKMKDSGVEWIGKIPEDWEIIPNKHLMKKVKNLCPVYNGEDILSLSMKGVYVRDPNDESGKRPTTYNGYQYVQEGDLLMCLFDIDVTPRCVGRVYNDGLTSPAYSRFVMNKTRAIVDYYYYYYLALDFDKTLLHLSKNMRSSLTESDFGSINAPVPSPTEQQQIVHFLDRKCTAIDTAIEKKKKAIEKWEEYKKSLIYYAVTGKIDCRNEVI